MKTMQFEIGKEERRGIIMDKIKPVLRLPGSKYKLVNEIEKCFLKADKKNFLELFGGTGILSVNIKNKYKNLVHVILNDYDNIFPLTKDKVRKNLTSYAGLGKYETKKGVEYFERRVKNGLWDKVKFYQDVIDSIQVLHWDYTLCSNFVELQEYFIYIDPPFYGNEKLYKNTVNHAELNLFIEYELKKTTWLLSINDCAYIRELYKDYYIKEIPFIYCSMGNSKVHKNKKELLISNKKLDDKFLSKHERDKK